MLLVLRLNNSESLRNLLTTVSEEVCINPLKNSHIFHDSERHLLFVLFLLEGTSSQLCPQTFVSVETGSTLRWPAAVSTRLRGGKQKMWGEEAGDKGEKNLPPFHPPSSKQAAGETTFLFPLSSISEQRDFLCRGQRTLLLDVRFCSSGQLLSFSSARGWNQSSRSPTLSCFMIWRLFLGINFKILVLNVKHFVKCLISFNDFKNSLLFSLVVN